MLRKSKLLFCLLLINVYACAEEFFVPEILYSKQSPFGLIEVVTTRVQKILNVCEDKNYSLAHSVIIQDDATYLGAEYQPLVTASLCFLKETKRILLLGLGAGEFLSYFINYFPKAHMDVIEINRVMIDILKKFRKVNTKKRVNFVVKNAFKHMSSINQRYDLIFCDIYFFKPSTIQEYKGFFENVRRSLNKNGVFVWNAYKPFIPRDVVENMFENFEHVMAAVTETDPNIVFICYQGREKTTQELKEIGNIMQAKYNFRYSLPDLINQFEFIESIEKEKWISQFPVL